MPAVQRTRTFEELAQSIAAKVELIPDMTDVIGDFDDLEALTEAYIEQHVNAESRVEMRTFLAERDVKGRAIWDALPPALQQEFHHWDDRRDSLEWIRQEVAYRIGFELGRRLAGGAR